MDIDLNALYTLNPDFVIRSIVDECFIIPVAPDSNIANNIIILNDTAAFMFMKIKENARVGEIIDALTEEYDVTYEQAKEDVAEMLIQFGKLGVIL